MFGIKFFFPSQEIFDSDRGECSKFRSLIYCFFDDNYCFFCLGRLALDKILMYPISGLFYDIIDDRFMFVVVDDFFDFIMNMYDIISCQSGNRLKLIFDGCFWIFMCEFEHEIDLIL